MSDKRLKAMRSGGLEAIWNLLISGDVYYRVAGILLLEAYSKQLVASGKGELASRIVQTFRDLDPYKYTRPHDKKNVLRP